MKRLEQIKNPVVAQYTVGMRVYGINGEDVLHESILEITDEGDSWGAWFLPEINYGVKTFLIGYPKMDYSSVEDFAENVFDLMCSDYFLHEMDEICFNEGWKFDRFD